MRKVQASEAKTHFASLLDEVERGASLVITRHGRAIARLVPEADRRRAEVIKALQRLDAFRTTMPRLSVEDILSAGHQGHKY